MIDIRLHHIIPIKFPKEEIDKFKEINCFECKKMEGTYITPESCTLRREAIKNDSEYKFNVCNSCDLNFNEIFFEVFRKRIKYNFGNDINDEEIEKSKEKILEYFESFINDIIKREKISYKNKVDRIMKNESKRKKAKEKKKKTEEKSKEENKTTEKNINQDETKIIKDNKNIFHNREVHKPSSNENEILQNIPVGDSKEKDGKRTRIEIKKEKIDIDGIITKEAEENKIKLQLPTLLTVIIDKKHLNMLNEICEFTYRTPEMEILYMIKDKFEKIQRYKKLMKGDIE